MSLKSLQIKKTCPECGKTLEEKSSKIVEGIKVVRTVCGHVIFDVVMESNEEAIENFISEDGRKLRKFQIQRIKDSENANGRVLLNQQMGLGKTVIFAGLAKIHFDEMKPILIVCKAGLKLQMFWEMHRWIGKREPDGEWNGVISQVIDSIKEKPLVKFFKVVIISYETLAQAKWVDDEEYTGLFKTIFLDECQKIKNPEAKMTKAVRKLCSGNIITKRKISPTLEERKRVEVIANDLMKYHGIKDRFTLSFEENLPKDALGLTECKCENGSEGVITGRITLDLSHALHASENEVIETILHEIAHAITPGAGHSKIWRDTCREIGGNAEQFAPCDGTREIKETTETAKYIIAASGTPIKNNAAEYFTILNILKPERFYNKADFEKRYVEQVWNGNTYKKGGIKENQIEKFKSVTQDFIFRDTRIEVEPDLPLIDRQWLYSELGTEVQKAYCDTLDEFNKEFAENDDMSSMSAEQRINLLAFINKMRQIVGMSKVAPCLEYCSDFLEENESEKLVIFVHHIAAGNVLRIKLERYCNENGFGSPLTLTSDMDSTKRQEVVESFRTDPSRRILIASTLAAGEGLNLQFCSHCVLMERQWNPANEEQAETRFTRIGSIAKSVVALYIVAMGTIDEWLAELVEKKRAFMASALDGESIAWEESAVIGELFLKLKTAGKPKWKLPV